MSENSGKNRISQSPTHVFMCHVLSDQLTVNSSTSNHHNYRCQCINSLNWQKTYCYSCIVWWGCRCSGSSPARQAEQLRPVDVHKILSFCFLTVLINRLGVEHTRGVPMPGCVCACWHVLKCVCVHWCVSVFTQNAFSFWFSVSKECCFLSIDRACVETG